MIKLALVGKNISHSKSPDLYKNILNEEFEYDLLDYASESEIPSLTELSRTYYGINITAPYKKHFLNQLDENDSKVLGVNTIKLNEKFHGTNTDYLACVEIIKDFMAQKKDHIVILGDGVMGQLIKEICEELSIEYNWLSRKKNNLDHASEFIKDNNQSVVINCCAREYKFVENNTRSFLFWDLNYLHEFHTQFYKDSSVEYVDGMGLLELQARYAVSFWNLKTN